MTYAEKLLDPRWQKKRLEVLERDSWTCQLCGDKETTFHIHHFKYNNNPWDANNDDLVCYCKHCHSVIEYNKKHEKILAIRIIKVELQNGDIKLHLVYIDESGEMYIDIYSYDKKGALSYNCSISDRTLDRINMWAYPKAEAP